MLFLAMGVETLNKSRLVVNLSMVKYRGVLVTACVLLGMCVEDVPHVVDTSVDGDLSDPIPLDPNDEASLKSNDPSPVGNQDASACQTRVTRLESEIISLTTQLTAARELADAAQKTMESEAKANIKAQALLEDYKRTSVEALAAEVKVREAAERELAVQKEIALAIAKELEEHKLAVDGLKDELAKEIERSLELKRSESVASSALMDKVVAYDLLSEKYAKLQDVYHEALDHLAHPMLSEYLAARGKELGEMRPELRAALDKAKEVIALPPEMLDKLDQGKEVLNRAREHLRSGVAPYVGDKHASSVSLGLIVFLMLPPVYLVYRFVQSIHRTLQAYHFVLVLNFLAMCYFTVIASSSFFYQEDVLLNLQKNNGGAYAILQFATIGFFGAHLWWSGIFAATLSDGRLKYAQLAHVATSVLVIVHYYEHVWSRAMLDQEHQVHEALFLVYAVVYGAGLVPALLSSVKNNNTIHASSFRGDDLKQS
ncbi:hypothetical protein LEN26_011457 [Aphanomyces euteiches]|nr:hypothetical protein LEN26_011457 [Aphanomyces euteiches]KAH9120701.1 hypothetical protein AeMF1_007243 [Aphanomyces euteiches]